MISETAISVVAANRSLSSQLPLGLVVCSYAALAGYVDPELYAGMLARYLDQSLTAFLVVIIPALAAFALLRRPAAPASYLFLLLRQQWLVALVVLVGFSVTVAAFTTLKVSIPVIVPFYADPFLDALDRAIHGMAPWEYTHAFVPAWAEYALAQLYGSGWLLAWFGTLGFVAFWNDGGTRTRYLWAHVLTFICLGTGAALALASYGPIFSDRFGTSSAYHDLLAVLDRGAAGSMVREVSDYLYSSYRSDAPMAGAGISAMPSMHVAVATLNACLFWSLNRWLGVLGWAFVGLIVLGSVHFAWHYAVDAYLSLMLVSLIWKLTGWWLLRPPKQSLLGQQQRQ